jgi:hypothetical protein
VHTSGSKLYAIFPLNRKHSEAYSAGQQAQFSGITLYWLIRIVLVPLQCEERLWHAGETWLCFQLELACLQNQHSVLVGMIGRLESLTTPWIQLDAVVSVPFISFRVSEVLEAFLGEDATQVRMHA